jgi:2-dehydro-3-deoxyphosphogluconate aldolase/(4S)-4-hydroxy-2-oxoglutarate aldolase
MDRNTVKSRIQEVGIIPSVRVSTPELALFAAESVNQSGIPVAEITMTVPGAIGVIAQFIVGAGTVLDIETARKCLDAGAKFITSPGLIPKVVEFALKHNVVVIPGALTPSEVIAAWQAGGDFVKVFPCAQFGGDQYIRALKVPLPQVPLIASGGVNQTTAANFILAGASVLGIGSELIPREALQLRQENWIQELARRYIGIVRDTRAHMRVV